MTTITYTTIHKAGTYAIDIHYKQLDINDPKTKIAILHEKLKIQYHQSTKYIDIIDIGDHELGRYWLTLKTFTNFIHATSAQQYQEQVEKAIQLRFLPGNK